MSQDEKKELKGPEKMSLFANWVKGGDHTTGALRKTIKTSSPAVSDSHRLPLLSGHLPPCLPLPVHSNAN